jgi:hypothetical protein
MNLQNERATLSIPIDRQYFSPLEANAIYTHFQPLPVLYGAIEEKWGET